MLLATLPDLNDARKVIALAWNTSKAGTVARWLSTNTGYGAGACANASKGNRMKDKMRAVFM
jgi:hypothetical protein